jgi:transposase
MSKVRRIFSREFKLQAVREAELGTPTAELARRYELNPNLISRWCQEYRANPEGAFNRKNGHGTNDDVSSRRIAELEQMVGRLTMENSFLKKVLQQLERTTGVTTPLRTGAK